MRERSLRSSKPIGTSSSCLRGRQLRIYEFVEYLGNLVLLNGLRIQARREIEIEKERERGGRGTGRGIKQAYHNLTNLYIFLVSIGTNEFIVLLNSNRIRYYISIGNYYSPSPRSDMTHEHCLNISNRFFFLSSLEMCSLHNTFSNIAIKHDHTL